MSRGVNPSQFGREDAPTVAKVGKPAAPSAPSGGTSGPGSISDILAGLLAGGSSASGPNVTGDPRVVTALGPEEIKVMQANAAAQLAAGLTGPFSPEAEVSGYASVVAQLYGVNHPKAQAWVNKAMARNWDATTFGRYLRSQPGFTSTDVGRRMKADIYAAIGEIFGRIG